MTPQQYASERGALAESVLRQTMALLCAAFPHLSDQINAIGCNWDRALDALDSRCAWENATTESGNFGAANTNKGGE